MKDTYTNRLDAFRATLTFLEDPRNLGFWKEKSPLRFGKRAVEAKESVATLAAFCEAQTSQIGGIAVDKAREEKELEDAAYVLGKAVAVCSRDLNNEADAAKVGFSLSDWRDMRDAILLSTARETIRIARELLADHPTDAADCGITAELVNETEREANEFESALGTPRAAIGERRALTAALRDRFNEVEAIFAKMDGLVEQFPDDTFIDGYLAARSVVDAGHRRKKTAQGS
jgi:hypothetical protein